MFNVLKKFVQHGIVTIDYPNKPLSGNFIRGNPKVNNAECGRCGECMKRCPSAAIEAGKDGEISFNLDQCIFCLHCSESCPRKAISFTNTFELARKARNELRCSPVVIEERQVPEGEDFKLIERRLADSIKRIFGRSLQIREVDAGSCNACDYEINALNGPYNDIERLGIHFVASPRHADMLLVTGPAARNMELALTKTYNATPDPKLVVAVGACACSGGIFKDSYATRNGIDCVVPVDVYIPGCPPRPQAIIYGIMKAIERL